MVSLLNSGVVAELPAFLLPENQVLFFTVVVFFALLAILWKFAWGPIMHALEEREHNIQHAIDEAAKKLKDAEVKAAEYEKRLNASKDEAAAIIAEGKRDVDKIKTEMIAEANAEAARTLERAKKEIALARDAAVADIQARIVAVTSDVATKVVQREINANDHSRLIADAMNQISSGRN